MANILIIYGTRYGSTGEIAEKLAEQFKAANHTVDLHNSDALNDANFPNIHDYQGILIGSGIKIGNWTSSAKNVINLLKQRWDPNAQKSPLMGYFVGCGEAGKLAGETKAADLYINDFLKDSQLPVDYAIAFGPVYDFSKTSKYGFMAKFVLKTLTKKDDLNLDYKGRNDLRDWDRIQQFGKNFLANF